jgi:crossover junction endodeoxyribonuclease RuvC
VTRSPSAPTPPQRILGIDPGLRLTGYGIVDLTPGELEPTLIEGGVFRLDAKADMEQRLVQLRDDLRGLIEEHRPQRVAVEQLYAHYAHPRTAILMGHARGVILLCAAERSLPIEHLPSTEVKKSLTGHGHASKRQMQLAVQSQCGLAEAPEPADVADAIAIALCHARRLATEQLSQVR